MFSGPIPNTIKAITCRLLPALIFLNPAVPRRPLTVLVSCGIYLMHAQCRMNLRKLDGAIVFLRLKIQLFFFPDTSQVQAEELGRRTYRTFRRSIERVIVHFPPGLSIMKGQAPTKLSSSKFPSTTLSSPVKRQKPTNHMAIGTNGNKPNSIPHERDTMTQEHSATTMADEAKQIERPSQPVPNSPVKPDSGIRSKPNKSSDKTSSSEASTDRLLPFGWDPACISPHPKRGPRRTYRSGALAYYNPNPAFCKDGRIPPRCGRVSPPPEALHQHELDPRKQWPMTQLDPKDFPGLPLTVHFQPAEVSMYEPRPVNIAPANRPCVHVYGVPDLGHGFFEHSVRALKAGEEVPWVHGYPMPGMFPPPSGNDGGPSKKAEKKAEDSSRKGKCVRFAGETKNTKASAENKGEDNTEKEKKKSAIASSAKDGEKTSLASTTNPGDSVSRDQKEKDEEEETEKEAN